MRRHVFVLKRLLISCVSRRESMKLFVAKKCFGDAFLTSLPILRPRRLLFPSCVMITPADMWRRRKLCVQRPLSCDVVLASDSCLGKRRFSLVKARTFAGSHT